ncbi:FkbM family methyltransferase [Candidatus Kaiserbacteria bacterium]|nr:FkbM family methyltransferase [Candidatus Kaiserbacteria bacterium]
MKKVVQAVRRILNEKHPIRFVMSRILLRFRINLSRTLFFNNKLDVQTYLHASSAAHKLFIGKYDATLDSAVFSKYIEEGHTVFDVGANIGMYTTVAARLSKSGIVYAFEATPQTFSYLLDNVRLNDVKNVYPVYAAVCNEHGLVSFFEHKNSHEQNYISKGDGGTMHVPALKLSNFMDSVGVKSIDFLKIDVEGAELSVLKSLGDYINSVRVVYFEYTNRNSSRFGYDLEEIIQFFQNAGFEIFIPVMQGDLLVIKPFDLTAQMDTRNLLAIKKEEYV